MYLLAGHCRGHNSPLLQALSKEEFLVLAADWYEKRYPKTYEHYARRGKPAPIYLPGRKDVICEYIGEGTWKAYDRVSRPIREYRNVIMHDVAIGAILGGNGIRIVPRKECIQNYEDSLLY